MHRSCSGPEAGSVLVGLPLGDRCHPPQGLGHPTLSNKIQGYSFLFCFLISNVLQLNELLFRSLLLFIQNTVLLIQLKKLNDFS